MVRPTAIGKNAFPMKNGTEKFVVICKRELVRLLHDYEVGVKSREEIMPFIDQYFNYLQRLNLGVK